MLSFRSFLTEVVDVPALQAAVRAWSNSGHLTAAQRDAFKALLARTRPGGDLSAYRPDDGLVVYRGQDDATVESNKPLSFSKDKDYAASFGDYLFRYTIGFNDMALDLSKVGGLTGVDEREVIVMPGRRARQIAGPDEDDEA